MSSLPSPMLAVLFLLFLLFLRSMDATTFRITNNCTHTLWPATLSNSGISALPSTGFELSPSTTATMAAPPFWSGRIWARTACSPDVFGSFSCATGGCSNGKLACEGTGGIPPATLAEFTLHGADGKDFYDISVVDGYNVAMSISPLGTKGCEGTSCMEDLNRACPTELQVRAAGDGAVIACRSACEAFGEDEFCCRGVFGGSGVCKPSRYSMFFKDSCPKAYSYAYDDSASTFTCAGADYHIVFCP